MKKSLIGLTIGFLIAGCWAPVNIQMCTDVKDTQTCLSANDVTDIKKINTAADDALAALKNKDGKKLSEMISKDWVRFSPYTYVDLSKDIVISATDIKDVITNNTKYTRGLEAGSGDPIEMTFSEYRSKYIYNGNFDTEWSKYLNSKWSRNGNMVNTIFSSYGNDTILEYYIPGKSKLYDNMDRKSLTLIFTKEGSDRKLKWVVHGERTI